MKGRILTISVLFLLIGVVSCDTKNSVEPVYQQYFIKYYGQDGDQEANDFTVNSDGTIIIIGTSTFGINKRLYLLKVDPEGNEIWKKQLGSPTNEFAKDIEPILNGPDAGNFVIVSNVAKSNVDFDIRLTVINTNGDSLKSTLFNFLQSQEGRSITPLSDGGYFLSGKTKDTDSNANADLPITSPDIEDILIVRFQSDFGYSQSDVYRIGNSYRGTAQKIFQSGSQFFYAGSSDELTPGNTVDVTFESNLFFRIFTASPDIVSTKYSGESTLNETISSICKSPSGPFMAVGTQSDLTGTNKQLYVTIITTNFVVMAIQKDSLLIDGGSQREAVAVAPSGDFSFLVLANEFNAVGIRDIYLRKTNVQLGNEFEVRFGAPNNDDIGSAVAELPNGDILILGTMSLTNQKKIALIKLRSNGQF